MTEQTEKLVLFGHGTDGADGIAEGVHLRWFFDRRLGFPLGGFCLSRRIAPGDITFLRKAVYKEGDGFTTRTTHTLPAPKLNADLQISSPISFHASGVPQFPNKGVFIHFKEEITIKFPQLIKSAEVTLYIKTGMSAQLDGRLWEEVVDRQEKAVAPYEMFTLRVEGHDELDRIIILAEAACIRTVGYEWCETISYDGSRWKEIACPISLPYTSPHYPVEHKFSGRPMPQGDWQEARRRKDQGFEYQKSDFYEMRDLFDDMFQNDPPSSNQIRYHSYPDENVAGTNSTAEQTSMKALPSDFLHLSALDPAVARIIGLAYIDNKFNQDPAIVSQLRYDYKLTGTWTEGNIWLLEEHIVTFDVEPAGAPFSQFKVIEGLLFEFNDQEIGDVRSDLAETTRSIIFPETGNTILIIRFPESVCEVQLFVSGNVGSAEATGSIGILPSQLVAGTAGRTEEMLHLSRANGFHWVALRGDAIQLNKIAYDFSFIGHPQSEDVIYEHEARDLAVEPSHLPSPPTGLRLTPFAGQTYPSTIKEGEMVDARLQVGLDWKIPESIRSNKYQFVRYLAQRQSGGKTVLLNNGEPIIINSGAEDLNPATGESLAPGYLIDVVHDIDTYNYRVSGIDIFGRVSRYGNGESITLDQSLYPPPPAPMRIEATYVDAADPWLMASDRDALGGANEGLNVSWEWPSHLHEQGPDVDHFRVHVLIGWLNHLEIELLSVKTLTSPSPLFSAPSSIETIIGVHGLGELKSGDLIGGTFQSAGLFYPITKSEPHSNKGEILLWLARPQSADAAPQLYADNQEVSPGGAALLATRQQTSAYIPSPGPATLIVPQRSSLYVDYSRSSTWPFRDIEVTAHTSATRYTVMIIPPPVLPTAANGKRYMQVTVTAQDPRHESVTGTPATAIAIYRTPPPPPTRSLSENTYASFPDVFGKSSFSFRFPADGNGYEIYRTSLQSLIDIDQAERPSSGYAENDFSAYLAAYNNNPALRTAVISRILQPSVVAYDELDNDLFQALASLPQNNGAFSKLHNGKLLLADFEDAGDFVYNDENLPGEGAGIYFYRAKALDQYENASPMGPAAMPVYLRDVAALRPPAVQAIFGGPQEITLRWWPSRETHLNNYVIYRCQREEDTSDIRLMDIVGEVDPNDESALTPLPLDTGTTSVREGYEFRDPTTQAGVPYYYRLAAERQLSYDDGLSATVKSAPTAILEGKAYDVPPDPPVWDEVNSGWVYVDDDEVIYAWTDDLSTANNPHPAIRLIWTLAASDHAIMISQENQISGIGTVLQSFDAIPTQTGGMGALIIYQPVGSAEIRFSARSRSLFGTLSLTTADMIILRPQ